jgi:prepilin-type N-terminal cleavage/methylation domain-containing protein
MHRAPHSSNRARHGNGFTLVELLVVLVLIGVAASVVIPFAARSYGNFKLHLAADSMKTLFHEARSRSRFEGRVHAVIFMPPDRMGRQLILVREDGRKVEQVTLPAEIMLTSLQGDGGLSDSMDPIHFFPNGTCEARQFDLSNAGGKHLQIELTAVAGNTHEVRPGNGAE